MKDNREATSQSCSGSHRAWERGSDYPSSFEFLPMSLGVSLGTCEGREVIQPSDDRFCHTAIVGRSGCGKSNMVHLMEREDIRSGAGAAIIATHPEDAIYPLSCVPEGRMDDVVIIDATDELLPCLNPLGVDCRDRKAAQRAIESTIKLLKSGCEHGWAGPRFDSRIRAALGLMMVPGANPHIGMLQEMFTDPDSVKSLLRLCTDKRLYDYWTREFPAAQRSNDAGEVTDWVLSKATAFINNPTLAAMFGPGMKTIDFDDIVGNGKILVVLAPASIGDEVARIIRTWVIMEVFDATMRRGSRSSLSGCGVIRSGCGAEYLDPYFIYVDEFGEVASPEFARMLAQVRKRHVGLVLSFQNLDQLKAFNPREGRRTSEVLNSVLANVGTVIAYQTGVHDARILAERFNVDRRKLCDMRRFKPKAVVRLGAQECGPFELSVPLAPEPDDPRMPRRLFNRMVERGVFQSDCAT